jgi:hypothetical protein
MILDRDKKPAEPYVHQPYPALRYKEHGEYVKVNSAEEDAAAEAKGYTKTPPDPDVETYPAPPARPAPPKKAAPKK